MREPTEDDEIVRQVRRWLDSKEAMIENRWLKRVCWLAEQQLKARPEGGAWISVKDRLPEMSGYYQIWTTKMPPALTMDIIPSAYFYSAGEAGWSRHRGYGCHGAVTHWMPFPQPPMNSGGDKRG